MKRADEVLGVKIVGGLRKASTPWAGASLLVELFRRSGIEAVANKVLPAKGTAKGHVFLTLEDEEGLLNVVLKP